MWCAICLLDRFSGQCRSASGRPPQANQQLREALVDVSEPPAAVTDTHALVFHAAGGRVLGRKAAAHFDACERQQALLYVPAAVMWEMSLLARVSRINLRRPVRSFFDDLFSNPCYQPIDLS